MPGDPNPNWQTWALALAIVVWAVAQYGLVVWTLRDLSRRPRVRGDNKVAWALLILTLPLLGPLLYASLGPTSFLPRPGVRETASEPPGNERRRRDG